MKLRAVLLVILVLAAVVSVYFLARAEAQPRDLSTSTTVLSGNATTAFSYNATLRPNILYNATYVGPGESSVLFPALTTSVNLSYTFELNVSSPSSVAVIAHEELFATTPQWNYTLIPMHGGTTEFTNQTSVEVEQSLVVNLTSVARTFSLIQNETDVIPSEITIGYYSDVFYIVSGAGQGTGHLLTPTFNLTYTTALITTGNRTFTDPWTFNASGVETNPAYAPDLDAAAGITAAVFVGIGIVVYFWVNPWTPVFPRPKDEEAELEAIIGPYRDAVAETLSLPHKENIVVMKDWMDVVRAADMLAKPILHLKSDVEGRTRHIFYVVDGAIQYVYLHNVLAPESASPVHPKTGLMGRLRGPKNP